MNNFNFIKNILNQNNINNNVKSYNYTLIDELRHKNTIINYNKIGNINLKENFDIKKNYFFWRFIF